MGGEKENGRFPFYAIKRSFSTFKFCSQQGETKYNAKAVTKTLPQPPKTTYLYARKHIDPSGPLLNPDSSRLVQALFFILLRLEGEVSREAKRIEP